MLKPITGMCIALILMCTTLHAHPGGTDKYGGHTESATGQYHIHNPDGTITYTTKPTSTDSQQAPQAAPKQETPAKPPAATIVVEGEQKPVLPTVDTTPKTDTKEDSKVEQTPYTTYIYKEKTTPQGRIYTVLLVVSALFGTIGLCMISALLYNILMRFEGKKAWLDFILHIPFLIILLPALLGKLLFKLYALAEPQLTDEDFSDDY